MKRWSPWLLIAAVAAWPGRASAEIVTTNETQLTFVMPEGWRHTGVEVTRFHPGVIADVLITAGAEAHVFLSDAGCPRPAGAAWQRARTRFLPDELEQVWRTGLGDVEQGCHASRRGELVIIIATDDPTTWNRGASERLADALVEAANGPLVSAAVAAARLRSADPERGAPLALSLGAQVTFIGDRERYRNATFLYEAAGRLAVNARPVVARVEGKAGRASTGALRFDVELGLGPVLVRGDLVASVTLGAAVGGQTASDGDTFELPEDPIPVRLRIPVVAEIGKRLGGPAAVSARARIAWLPKDDVRRTGGSPTVGSDELTLESRLYLGSPRRVAFLVGLALDEALGTRMVMVTAGIGAIPF